MTDLSLFSIAGVLTASLLLASPVRADEPPVPCLDTKRDSTLKIQPAVPEGAEPQQVFGTLTSWQPETSTIGFHSNLSDKDELIPVKSLRFEIPRPNPVAQMALQVRESLGQISRSYSPAELSVAEGVLELPDCALTHSDNRLEFEGSVTFSATNVDVEGEVFEVKPPQGGGSSDSTRRKGG